MKKLLIKIKRGLVRIFRNKIDEIFWRFREIFDKEWPKSYISENSLNHPHRKLLIDIISTYFPFDSILEIGCASGPNLYLLAKKFPEVKFYGIDISKKAIEIAKQKFKKENITNVCFIKGKAEEFRKILNRNFDLIFTDACLIYIAPEKIELVLRNMIETTKKAIILCEMHTDFPNSIYGDCWIHNYKFLINKIAPHLKIKLTKIPENFWGGNWAKYGYIIEAIL